MDYLLNKAQYEFLRNGCDSLNTLVAERESVELSPSDLTDLEKMGCVKNGKLTEQMTTIAETLCQPLTVQRQRLINLDANIEQVLYYREGQALICVSENTEGVKIEAPYKNENDLEAMAQYFGGSVLKSIDFKLSLPTLEAFVLAGIWDCIRKKNAEKIYDEEVLDWVRKDDLVSLLQKVESSQSFAFYIKVLNDLKVDRSIVQKQLESLEKKGFIEGHERITLSDPTFEICLRFHHFKTMFQLTTALNDGTRNYGSEMFILQDGVTDLMLMEIGSEQVNFLTMASLEVISLLDAYYKNPKSFLGDLYDDKRSEDNASPKSTDTQNESSNMPKFCTECGAKRAPGAKFCPECGNKF